MTSFRRPAVLFDLDGTLIDSSRDLAAALNHVLRQDSLPPVTLDQVRAMIGDGAPMLIERAYRHHGSRPPDGTLDRYRARYAAHCLDDTYLYPGIRRMLDELAGDRTLAVVTNKPASFAEQVVEGLGLDHYFQALLGPEHASRRKPAPEHVHAALKRIGHRPDEAVMVGDSPTDVLAGRRAGTATIAVLWGFRNRDQLTESRPDRLVETVAELADALLDG